MQVNRNKKPVVNTQLLISLGDTDSRSSFICKSDSSLLIISVVLRSSIDFKSVKVAGSVVSFLVATEH